MSSGLAKLWKRPGGDRLLAVEAMTALAAAAFVIAFIPFRRIAPFAGKPPTRPAPSPAEQARLIERVRWAMGACARRAPWRALCFEQGLAAQWMLRRRGLAATLYYGVARSPEEGLEAHVWVRVGEAGVVGCGISHRFSELARFPAETAAPGARPASMALD